MTTDWVPDDPYVEDKWQRLNDALKDTGYVLHLLRESAPNAYNEQVLKAEFHRDTLTMLSV